MILGRDRNIFSDFFSHHETKLRTPLNCPRHSFIYARFFKKFNRVTLFVYCAKIFTHLQVSDKFFFGKNATVIHSPARLVRILNELRDRIRFRDNGTSLVTLLARINHFIEADGTIVGPPRRHLRVCITCDITLASESSGTRCTGFAWFAFKITGFRVLARSTSHVSPPRQARGLVFVTKLSSTFCCNLLILGSHVFKRKNGRHRGHRNRYNFTGRRFIP